MKPKVKLHLDRIPSRYLGATIELTVGSAPISFDLFLPTDVYEKPVDDIKNIALRQLAADLREAANLADPDVDEY